MKKVWAKTEELSTYIVRELPTGENESFKYVIYPDGTVEITEIKAEIGNVFEIPDTVDGYTVTTIGENLFAGKSISEITIPGTVTLIKLSAFSDCDNLEWINFCGSAEEWNCMTVFGDSAILENIHIATSYTDMPVGIKDIEITYDIITSAEVSFDYVKENCDVYFAVYVGDKLLSLSLGEANIADKEAVFEIYEDINYTDCEIRAFCWSKAENMRPASNALSVNFGR